MMTPWPANLPAAPVQFDRLDAIYLAIAVVAIIYSVWVLRRALKPEPPSELETEYLRFVRRQKQRRGGDEAA